MTNLAIKVDVDTLRGYREGVPRLLDLFRGHGIRASFFFSFGPDNSGKAIRRIFRRGFLSKMLRTKAPSTYGLKTMLYGTLLPAPLIVPSAPEIFQRACGEGHDCGVHAWDHVLVQDKLAALSEAEFAALFKRAAAMFEQFAGRAPASYAAPGWQVSEGSLEVLDRLGLDYASDARGHEPFLPVRRDRRFRTLQIPTTLPTMDEIWGTPGVTAQTLPDVWLGGMTHTWNVLTVHAEMEGGAQIGVMDDFLRRAASAGIRCLTLAEIAREANPKPAEIIAGNLPGRAGALALQGETTDEGCGRQ